MTHEIYLNEKEATRITDSDKMFLVLPLEGHDGGFQRGDNIHFVVTKTGCEFKLPVRHCYHEGRIVNEKNEKEELINHPLNEEDKRFVITYVEPLIDCYGVDESRHSMGNMYCVIGFRKGM